MKPIEFVMFDGDSTPSQPMHEIHSALKKDIMITNGIDEYQILSYYCSKKGMVLVITPYPRGKR